MKQNIIRRSLLTLFLILTIGVCAIIINASNTQVTIPDGSGVITHYKTNDPVYINSQYIYREGEFRGVWVSPYVADISGFTSEKQYKDMMYDVFDTMEAYGLNAMVYHVRIMNDALYPSKYCARSIYMDTDIDMLPWIIDECHKRGIEFHAWMNPYRVSTNVSQTKAECASKFSAFNIASNPDNLLIGQNSIILDPGRPEVRDWLVKVCMEVVENYDVDAIHFDDYFYDNGVDDTVTRNLYNTKNLSLGDFRREQVDLFIEALSNAIREYNTNNNERVQLGISPSGVYTAGNGVVTYDSKGNASSSGSLTASASFQHYGNYLYCDTVKWINNEWIDYILPQTYWALNHPSCPYYDLMEWWSKIVKYKNVKLYSGIGLYQKGGLDKYGWTTNDSECYYQIMTTNYFEDASGVCFFKYSNIASAVVSPSYTKGVQELFSTPAILPEINTMDEIPINDVTNLSVRNNGDSNVISFDKNDDAKFYVIYRSLLPLEFSPTEVYKVIGDLSDDGTVEWADEKIVSSRIKYYYGVRAMSKSNTLSSGVSIYASDIDSGNGVNLGTIDEVLLSNPLTINSTNDILFTPLYYPYGGKISYTLSYKFDNGEEKEVTTFNTKNSYLKTTINTINDFNELTITIKAKNSVGESTYTKTFKKVEVLGNITNFGVLNTPYSYQYVTFVWNNLYIDDAIYTISYSTDEINWEVLKEVSTVKDSFNLTQKVKLPGLSGTVYYRVTVTKDDLVGYSDTISYNMTNYLGDFKELTINGNEKEDYIILSEGDTLVIKYKKFNDGTSVSNSVSISSDMNTFTSLSSYNRSSKVTEDDNYVTITIPLNGNLALLYVRILSLSSNGQSLCDDIKVYCLVEYLYSDEVLKYLANNTSSYIRELGLFN